MSKIIKITQGHNLLNQIHDFLLKLKYIDQQIVYKGQIYILFNINIIPL